MRTHRCGLVDETLMDQEVTLCGWVIVVVIMAVLFSLIYVILKVLLR